MYCQQCDKSLKLPKGTARPHSHICPLCSYQVLNITTHNGKNIDVCPHCYSSPPPEAFVPDIEQSDMVATQTTMPCFACSYDCPLARKTIPLMSCPACGTGQLELRKPKTNYVIGKFTTHTMLSVFFSSHSLYVSHRLYTLEGRLCEISLAASDG